MSRAEEFIQNYTRNCSNEIIGGGWNNGEHVQIFNPWLTPDEARRAVEIAREELMEDAKESDVIITSGGILLSDLRIEDFNYEDKVKVIIVKDE